MKLTNVNKWRIDIVCAHKGFERMKSWVVTNKNNVINEMK